jgi:hypothetical protein
MEANSDRSKSGTSKLTGLTIYEVQERLGKLQAFHS